SKKYLGKLGDAVRDYFFKNLKTVKQVSDAVQSPVTSVFGDGAKFDLFRRDDEFWAGLTFKGEIPTTSGREINYGGGIQISEGGDARVFIDMGIIVGPTDRRPSYPVR